MATASVLRPAVAFGGIICMFGIEQFFQARSGVFASQPELINFAMFGLVIIGLSSSMVRGRRILQPFGNTAWLTVALYGFAALSLLWSVSTAPSFPAWKKALPYMISVALLTPLLIQDPKDLRTAFFSTLTIGFLICLSLIADNRWSGRFVVLEQGIGIGALASDAGNPLAIASMAGYVTLIGMLMNFKRSARVWQVLRWAVVAIGLGVAIRSGSRGQLFALLIAAGAFLPLSRRFASAKGLIGTFAGVLLVAGLAYWAHDQFAERSRWRWDTMVDAYNDGRVSTSVELIRYWLNSSPVYWVIGLGSSASFDPKILGFYPHLVMVEVLCELGLIGFVLLWSVVISVALNAARSYTCVRMHDEARGLLAAICALFLFEVVLSFKQGSMISSYYAFCFGIMATRYALLVQERVAAFSYMQQQAEMPLPQPRLMPV